MKKFKIVILLLLCLVGAISIDRIIAQPPPSNSGAAQNKVDVDFPPQPSNSGVAQNEVDVDLPPPSNSGAAQNKVDVDLPPRPSNSGAAQNKVDLDLTKLNNMMVYSTIRTIMFQPNSYLRKTIRIGGIYHSWCPEEEPGFCYRFVVVGDAAACCQAGLEFRLRGNDTGGYPAIGAMIEITGVLSSYQMNDRTLYYLAANDMTVKN